MTPLEFMQRLAALVPRPRLHLIRFHGVLAPNAKMRPLVVPHGPQVQEADTEATAPAECEVDTARARPQRISWARLLKWAFDTDMHTCPNCGGAVGAAPHVRSTPTDSGATLTSRAQRAPTET